MSHNISIKLNSVYIVCVLSVVESTRVEITKGKQQGKRLQKGIISKLIIKVCFWGLFSFQQNIINVTWPFVTSIVTWSFFFFKDSISQIKLFQIKQLFRTIRHKGNFFSHTLNRDLKEKLAHFFVIWALSENLWLFKVNNNVALVLSTLNRSCNFFVRFCRWLRADHFLGVLDIKWSEIYFPFKRLSKFAAHQGRIILLTIFRIFFF